MVVSSGAVPSGADAGERPVAGGSGLVEGGECWGAPLGVAAEVFKILMRSSLFSRVDPGVTYGPAHERCASAADRLRAAYKSTMRHQSRDDGLGKFVTVDGRPVLVLVVSPEGGLEVAGWADFFRALRLRRRVVPRRRRVA